MLRRAIDELTTTGRTVLHLGTSFTRPSIAFEITQSGRSRHPSLILLTPTMEDIWRSFDVRILFAFQACAAQLRVCSNGKCSRIFLTTGRSDRQYCPGKKCGQAQRQRKYRVAKKLAKAKFKQKQLGARTRRSYGTKARKR